MNVGDQPDKTVHDLQRAMQEYNVGFVLDISTRYHEVCLEKLKLLQDMLQNKVMLMYGYTPKENYVATQLQVENLADKLRNEIEFDMKIGYLKILPSFIGELLITDLRDPY